MYGTHERFAATTYAGGVRTMGTKAKKAAKKARKKPAKKSAAKKAGQKPAAKRPAAAKKPAPVPSLPKPGKPLTLKQRLSLIRIDPMTGKCPHGLAPETCSFCMSL